VKLYLEPVQVTATDGSPTRIIWQRRIYRVISIHETWLYNGRWWTTPKLVGRFRCYYCLTAKTMNHPAVEMEIYQESGRWMLSRVLD